MAIPELVKFREKYPDYNDMDDAQLAQALAKKYPDAYGDLPGKVTRPQLEPMPSHSPVQQIEDPQNTWRGTVSRFARPALEGGGAAVGGVVGAGAGLASGPGAPVASPALGAAGGGLGYAIGKRAADTLDETLGLRQPKGLADTAIESAGDVATGAALEMGGAVLAPAFMAVKSGGKTVFRAVTDPIRKAATKGGAERAAGEILQANTSAGPIYAQNAQEAAEIEKQIPGLKFTAGQRTNDPALIKLERAQMRKPGTAADISAEQTARNNEALKAYYQKNFGGEEGIDDLISSLQGQRAGLQGAEQSAANAVQSQSSRLPAVEPPQTGQRIVDTLKQGKSGARAQAGELYDAVPPMSVPVDEMLDDFDRISQPMSRFEPTGGHMQEGNVPGILRTVIDGFEEGAERVLSLEDLQGLRSELLAQSRSARSSQTPNERLASRLDQAARSVEKAIKGAEGPEGGAAALRDANKFFRENYAQVFRQGTIGDILRPGARGEATRTPLAQIPGKIWNSRNLSAADDFIKAAPESKDIMRDHAAYDLLQNVTDAQGNIVTGKLNGWMARNRPLLKKFDLEGDFAGIAKAQQAADAAKSASAEFEKSVAARILNADPERAVAAAFSGRSAGKEAARLMEMVKGDKAAVKGLQRAFADHMMDVIQTTAKDVSGNPVVSNAAFQRNWAKYAPVMRVVYKNEPKKIAALNTMRKAYEVGTRNTRSPIGGGSDTAENIFSALTGFSTLSRTANIARGLTRLLTKHGDDKANEFVNRALFDPDYAETLIAAARGKVPEKELQAAIDGKIIQLSDYRKARNAAAISGLGAASGIDE